MKLEAIVIFVLAVIIIVTMIFGSICILDAIDNSKSISNKFGVSIVAFLLYVSVCFSILYLLLFKKI